MIYAIWLEVEETWVLDNEVPMLFPNREQACEIAEGLPQRTLVHQVFVLAAGRE